MKTLEKHQLEFINWFGKDNKRAYIEWPTGVGKTYLVPYMYAKLRQTLNRPVRMLCVTPPGIMAQFESEFLKKGFPADKIAKLTKKQVASDSFEPEISDYRVIIIPYTALVHWNKIKNINADMLIIDEAHMFKTSPTSCKGTAYMFKLVAHCKFEYRVLMSATPTVKNLSDLWSQMYILDDGKRLGVSEEFYISRFMTSGGMYQQKTKSGFTVLKDKEPKNMVGAEEAVAKLRSDITHIIGKREALPDLPPDRSKNVLVDLYPDQKAMYEECLEAMAIEIGMLTGRGVEGGIKDMKIVDHISKRRAVMRQIASGFIYNNDIIRARNIISKGEIVELPATFRKVAYNFKNNQKLEATRELLKRFVLEENRSVIIWTVFVHTYKMLTDLCKSLGIESRCYSSKISLYNRNKMKDDFNQRRFPVVISHPASGGTGLDFIASSRSIRYSSDYNYGQKHQSEGRDFRKGSEIHDTIDRYTLLTRNTIDTEILSNLSEKEIILKLLKKFTKKHKELDKNKKQ